MRGRRCAGWRRGQHRFRNGPELRDPHCRGRIRRAGTGNDGDRHACLQWQRGSDRPATRGRLCSANIRPRPAGSDRKRRAGRRFAGARMGRRPAGISCRGGHWRRGAYQCSPPAPSIARDAGRRDLLGGSKRETPIDDHRHRAAIGRDYLARCKAGHDRHGRPKPRRNQRLQSDLARGRCARGPCGKRPRGTAGKRDAHRFSWRAICRADHCHPAECTGGKPDDYRARGDAQPRPSPETGHVCAGHDRS